MTIATEQTVVELDEHLDISRVRQLHAELAALLAAGRPVRFSAARLLRADTAVLQLFAAFVRQAQAHGLAINWDSPTEALLRSARLLGLSEAMALSSGPAH